MQNPSSLEGSPAVSPRLETERLDSWKEIAAFFRREVRTVQLWEKHEGLPVRRQHHRRLGSVYAIRSELQEWWIARSALSNCTSRSVPDSISDTETKPSNVAAISNSTVQLAGCGNEPLPDGSNESGRNGPDRSRETLSHYACIMGAHYWNDRSRSAIQKAFRYFQDAVELDPNCAEGYAGLANVYISLSYNHMFPAPQAALKAQRAVRRALGLNSSSSTVRNAAVNVLINCAWDWTAAERECRQMFEAGAMNTRTVQLYSSLLNAQGRHGEAVQLALQACRLEPMSAIANNQVSMAYFYSGDYESALPYSRRTLELAPKFTMGQALLGRVQAQRGEWKEALSSFTEVATNSAQAPFAQALMAYAHAGGGDRQAAHEIVAELVQLNDQPSYPAYDISGVYSILNLREDALQNINRACESRDMKAIFFRHDPRFTNLRTSSGFQQIALSHLPIAS